MHTGWFREAPLLSTLWKLADPVPLLLLNAVKKGLARLPCACGAGAGHRIVQETRLSAPVPRS